MLMSAICPSHQIQDWCPNSQVFGVRWILCTLHFLLYDVKVRSIGTCLVPL